MKPADSEHRLENVIGNLLRVGVVSATIVVFAGAIWHLLSGGSQLFAHTAFHGEPSELKNIGEIVAGAMSGSGKGLIQLGLLILLATPVARVVLSLVGFGIQRDRMYVLITGIVLVVLSFSLLGG